VTEKMVDILKRDILRGLNVTIAMGELLVVEQLDFKVPDLAKVKHGHLCAKTVRDLNARIVTISPTNKC
jgi:hypothetical protein